MNINGMSRISAHVKAEQLEIKWQELKANPLLPKDEKIII